MPSSGLFQNYRSDNFNWRTPLAFMLIAFALASIGVVSLQNLPVSTPSTAGILDPFGVNDWAGQADAYLDGKVELTYSVAMTRSGEQHDFPITFYLPTFGQAFERTSALKAEVLHPSPFTEAFSRITNSSSGTLIQSVPIISEENKEFVRAQQQVWEAIRFNFELLKAAKQVSKDSIELWIPILMAGATSIDNFSFVVNLPEIPSTSISGLRIESAKNTASPAETVLADPIWDKGPGGGAILMFSSSTPIQAPNGLAVVLSIKGATNESQAKEKTE